MQGKPRQVVPNVHEVGYIDWDRDLFEDLLHLKEGTTYNSYLIQGKDKTVLIDTVDDGKHEYLFENLDIMGIKKLDYVIALHAEQDHSSSIPFVLERYPGCKVMTSAKCKELLEVHMPVLRNRDEEFVLVDDSTTVDLGGKTLEFVLAPWVHWEDTMFCHLKEDKILFTTDMFGAHLTKSELFVDNAKEHEEFIKLYFAEIMMPFRLNVEMNMDKVSNRRGIKPAMIAPAHGGVYRDVEGIWKLYSEWVDDDKLKNVVLIPYASMHFNITKMVDRLVYALNTHGVQGKPFHLTRNDFSRLTVDLVDAPTIVLGTGTIIGGPHPFAHYATYLLNMLRPKTKHISLLTSYAWKGRTIEIISNMITAMKPEIIPPVEALGCPDDEDFAKIDKLAEEIAKRHKALGLIA